MKVKDLKKLDDEKYILIDAGAEVFDVEIASVSDAAVWLKVKVDD